MPRLTIYVSNAFCYNRNLTWDFFWETWQGLSTIFHDNHEVSTREKIKKSSWEHFFLNTLLSRHEYKSTKLGYVKWYWRSCILLLPDSVMSIHDKVFPLELRQFRPSHQNPLRRGNSNLNPTIMHPGTFYGFW